MDSSPDSPPFADLSSKRPSHSASLTSDLSDSTDIESVINEPELLVFKEKAATSLVDLTTENSGPSTSLAYNNSGPSGL